MGFFRFRRSIRIFPGARLNIGKRGVSTSIGVRGAHVTFGKTGTRTTVGVPGTGLSYTNLVKPQRDAASDSSVPEAPKGRAWRGWLWIVLIVVTVAMLVLRNK
jgi:hypothetical protein